MGFRAASAKEVYRYALRLDKPNRSLTDKFGFSLVFINDGSPVCIEFLQRYFVDLCHRTADRIRFIFFSDIDERELDQNVRYDRSPLQVVLRMLSRYRDRYSRYFDVEDEYLERRLWDDLRPRVFSPIHFPEQTFNELNFDTLCYSTVPGRREAHLFAQQLGIGRHVPCIVAFNDIGSLSVDVMPISGMSRLEIYAHVRKWVDSFYEKNQRIFHYLSEVERNIEQLQKKSRIPLHKINEWQYRCQNSWNKLRITANAISEVSSLKENDRVGFVNLVEKYKRDYNFPNEVIKDFEKDNNYWRNPEVVEILLEVEETLVDAIGFEKLLSKLKTISSKSQFKEKYCPNILKKLRKLKKLKDITENITERHNIEQHIFEHRRWWKKRAKSQINYDKFRLTRKKWEHLLNQSYSDEQIQTELKHILKFARQFPLSIKPKEGGEKTRCELAKYYSIEPNNEQWIIATKSFLNLICNYINTIQKTCPKWFIQNNPNIAICDAIPLDNDTRNDCKIELLSKDHPLFIAIIENSEPIEIIQENEKIAYECRIQCLQGLRESIKKYTLSDDQFHQMYSGLIDLLQKYRNQLEGKVDKIQKELLSVGLLQKQITNEEIQKLRHELDKYQSIVNQFIYPHKSDSKVINVSIPQSLVKACGFSSQNLANQNRNQKNINTLKQEIDSAPREEKENLEKWEHFTETAKRYSPEYALSHALRKIIPKAKLQEVFGNTEDQFFEENISTQIKQGNVVLPLLKLTESNLTKAVKLLSRDTNNRSLKFAEQTRPVEQVLILIGADVISAQNYINQFDCKTMANLQPQIFSDLEQNDIRQLESSLNKLFQTKSDSVGGKKSLLSNAGVDSYFIGNLDFNLNDHEFVSILVAKFKQYRVSSRKPDYHPLISFLDYLIEEPDKYNFDDQDLEIFDKVITIGKQKIQELSTINLQNKTNLIISKIGNSEPVIGIITALEKEYVAVQAVFDQGRDEKKQGEGAGRRYWLTDVADSEGTPRTVAVTLGDMGNNIAAIRATNMLHHYPTVKSIIMCGIAGGVPHPTKGEDHVRLGDIVVSNKKGIVQYDFDKESQRFTEIRAMPVAASAELVEAARYLRVNEMSGQRPWEDVILKALQKLKWQRPPQETDLLYSSVQPDELICHPEDSERRENQPRIFLGAIGSANKLLKNPQKRDLLREQFGVKAIEMEGSGVADATWNQGTGYVVVRGICDYCDEHKSDTWQKYAAVTAAAYIRTLLSSI